jgi:C1A family cysteine protease
MTDQHQPPTTKFSKKYGWRPSLKDHRDHIFGVSINPSSLPPFVDLRPQCPPILNQGQSNSCTAHATSSAFAFDYAKQNLGTISPSRLFIYYNERLLEGTVASDCGATLRDGVSTLVNNGVPDESLWPFDLTQISTAPPQPIYAAASKNKATSYSAVTQTRVQIRAALATGVPMVFGFSVYEEFESDVVASTGILPMPAATSELLGGHAVVAVGYNFSNTTQNDCPPNYYIIRNSWGADWGFSGYFFMPATYLENPNLASDLWVIKTVN